MCKGFTLLVCVWQATLAITLGLMGNGWKESEAHEAWYLRLDVAASAVPLYEAGVIPLRFLLLMSTMIPLSIQVPQLYHSLSVRSC